ncbi:hypothetical protein BV25DRAFT_1897268 [Artomyces pyxidatus]|uniref:Uncharacterized protein n=1 Tax=Artomyces pyxidatus TaxID=48021 RepID=A0ACB8TF60_9AGAM|nr:hypothetical protein BV25DRAFT_1897268 [Artomyces pyxidatus]
MSPIGERCENCLKHPAYGQHPIGKRCSQCLPGNATDLPRCTKCKVTSQCSKKCQKAHRSEHKWACDSNIGIQRQRAAMGEAVAARQSTFEKWCEDKVQDISLAGISALELQRDSGRIDTHVFLVYVDVVEHASPRGGGITRTFTRTIRDARCETRMRVHQMFDGVLGGGRAGYVALERSLVPIPKMMPMLVIDDDFPPPLNLYTLPMNVLEYLAGFKYDGDSLSKLKAL